jgi:hypothetical protein
MKFVLRVEMKQIANIILDSKSEGRNSTLEIILDILISDSQLIYFISNRCRNSGYMILHSVSQYIMRSKVSTLTTHSAGVSAFGWSELDRKCPDGLI